MCVCAAESKSRTPSKALIHKPKPSNILGTLHDLPLNFRPINLVVHLLINLAANHHIVATDQVQAVIDLGAGFVIIGRSNDALDGL